MQLKDVMQNTKVKCPFCKKTWMRHMKKWRNVDGMKLPWRNNEELSLIMCCKCYKNFMTPNIGYKKWENLPYFIDHDEARVITYLKV